MAKSIFISLCLGLVLVSFTEAVFEKLQKTSGKVQLQQRNGNDNWDFYTGGIGTHKVQDCSKVRYCDKIDWKPCVPPKDNVNAFVAALKDFVAGYVQLDLLVVDLEYEPNNVPGAGLWLWDDTIPQPVNSGWYATLGFPVDPIPNQKLYGFMTKNGLENGVLKDAPICCFSPKAADDGGDGSGTTPSDGSVG